MQGWNGMMGGGMGIWWVAGVLVIIFLVVAILKVIQKR